MKQELHIVIDGSGSMMEQDKNEVINYYLPVIRRFFKEHQGEMEVQFFAWNQEVKPTKPRDLTYSGKLEESTLSDFIKERTKQPETFVLLISDGFYSPDLGRVFRKSPHTFLLLLGRDDVHTFRKKHWSGGRLLTGENLLSDLHFFSAFIQREREDEP